MVTEAALRDLNPLDVPALRAKWLAAAPFPFIELNPLLRDDVAREIAASYPTYAKSRGLGHEFSAVNEQRKVQICNSVDFPDPVKRLNAALSSPEFLSLLSEVTGIPKLLADDRLVGGGMHVTGPGGRLDVHVDFNYVDDRKWHRRLNILVYLNPGGALLGGAIELWDRDVKRCHHSFLPELNRCVIFETSEFSYHGVSPVSCPRDVSRHSFAAYYYTEEPHPHWTGESHSTIFKARPSEWLRGAVMMPFERARRRLQHQASTVKRALLNRLIP